MYHHHVDTAKKLAIKRARVNIKSLAAEIKIIKAEIRKTADTVVKNDLHEHHVNKVRPEARLANLAIGYLKGRKIGEVEKTAKLLNFAKLREKIARFCPYGLPSPTLDDVIKWAKNS
jgi:hypothetical protein